MLAFTRTWEGDVVLCAANGGGTPARLELPGAWADLDGRVAWPARRDTGLARIELPPMTGLLLRRLPEER